MENRFGFKELVLSALMVAIIVVLLLAMRQYDRQWTQLDRITTTLKQQNEELRRMSDLLSQGIRVSSSDGTRSQNDAAQVFPRIEAARAMPGYAPGDWYVDAVGAAIGKLTPLTSSDVYQSMVSQYVLQSLADRDPETLEWRPLVAKAWQISDDGLTISF